MRKLLIVLCFFGFVSLANSQNASNLNCSALLEVGEIVEQIDIVHYIFTGQDTTGLNVKVEKIQITKPRKEMVRRKVKDCISLDPNDCIVETLEEIPAVTMNLYTLSGPDITDEYETRTETVSQVKREAGLIDTPIICPSNRSKKLIERVQSALIERGYPLSVNGELDQATLLSIIDYQRENNLPYGDLTLEVVASLGVR